MIEIGSNYFFKNIEGFIPKDLDYIKLVDKPKGFNYVCHIKSKQKCIFIWKKMNVNNFISYTISHCSPMAAGKFLVKEFCDEIGFTVNDLEALKSTFDRIDDKHKYQKIIYNYYLQNNSFTLTNEQLYEAYKEYIKYRK